MSYTFTNGEDKNVTYLQRLFWLGFWGHPLHCKPTYGQVCRQSRHLQHLKSKTDTDVNTGTPDFRQLLSGAFLTCIHGQHFVIAKHAGDKLLIGSQHIIVECSGSQAEFGGLGVERGYNLGVAVALIHCTVSTQEVIIPVAVHVPHMDAWRTEGHRVFVTFISSEENVRR